jgi:hypothetical protein
MSIAAPDPPRRYGYGVSWKSSAPEPMVIENVTDEERVWADKIVDVFVKQGSIMLVTEWVNPAIPMITREPGKRTIEQSTSLLNPKLHTLDERLRFTLYLADRWPLLLARAQTVLRERIGHESNTHFSRPAIKYRAKKAASKNKLWRGVQSMRMLVLGKLLTGDPQFLDYARSDKLWGIAEFNVN